MSLSDPGSLRKRSEAPRHFDILVVGLFAWFQTQKPTEPLLFSTDHVDRRTRSSSFHLCGLEISADDDSAFVRRNMSSRRFRAIAISLVHRLFRRRTFV